MAPSDSHQEFEELCALAATGELTREEWLRLEAHLAECDACREALRQYERVIAMVIPALGVETAAEREDENAPGSWSIEEAEERLMRSLREEPAPAPIPIHRVRPFWSTHAPRYAMAAALLIACSLAGYLFGVFRERGSRIPAVPAAHTAASSSSPQNAPVRPAPAVDGEKTASQLDQNIQLRTQVRRSRQEVGRLNDELDQSQDALARQKSELERAEQERADLARQLTEAQGNAQSLEARLSLIQEQTAQDTAQSIDLKAQVHDLTAALDEKDKAIARQRELLNRDSDIRNLIGARNLYLAEIYDVAKTGDTQKPFGRVFYTKDKSLILYGYDLDQQHGIKKDAAFQAWGRSGADPQHNVSLGLLYQDDANKKRWVLKFNDPKTIAQIDAVFVTVEPEGGSSKPSGKPLLFTYLRLDPNHP
jgi:anti-sigma factor RsiW